MSNLVLNFIENPIYKWDADADDDDDDSADTCLCDDCSNRYVYRRSGFTTPPNIFPSHFDKLGFGLLVDTVAIS